MSLCLVLKQSFPKPLKKKTSSKLDSLLLYQWPPVSLSELIGLIVRLDNWTTWSVMYKYVQINSVFVLWVGLFGCVPAVFFIICIPPRISVAVNCLVNPRKKLKNIHIFHHRFTRNSYHKLQYGFFVYWTNICMLNNAMTIRCLCESGVLADYYIGYKR